MSEVQGPDLEPWVRGADVPGRAGITYRQFDYWVRRGFLNVQREPGAGSGVPRLVHWREVQVARLMGELTAVGVEPEVAAAAARQLQEGGAARLGPFEVRRWQP